MWRTVRSEEYGRPFRNGEMREAHPRRVEGRLVGSEGGEVGGHRLRGIGGGGVHPEGGQPLVAEHLVLAGADGVAGDGVGEEGAARVAAAGAASAASAGAPAASGPYGALPPFASLKHNSRVMKGSSRRSASSASFPGGDRRGFDPGGQTSAHYFLFSVGKRSGV